MLEKIVRIDNVGVFKAGVPAAVSLKKVALLYADNARGKSTLSSLFRACSTADASSVQARRTVGATSAQAVQFLFQAGSKNVLVSFDGTAWSTPVANLHVFNHEFVERNVYAGRDVSPEQRASLLELALGADAVSKRMEFQGHADAQRIAAQRVTGAEQALQGYHRGLTLQAFLDLEKVDNGDTQLAALDQRLQDARGVQQVLQRPSLREVQVSQTDLAEVRVVLAAQFEQLQAQAEQVVRQHFDAHRGKDTERWAAEGMHHQPDEACPFCGQDTTGVALLDAYQAYFNDAYREHLRRVGSLQGAVAQKLPGRLLPEWSTAIEFNQAAIRGWAGQVELIEPHAPLAEARALLEEATRIVSAAVEQKAASPLAHVDTSGVDQALALVAEVSSLVEVYNSAVREAATKIDEFKNSLKQADVQVLTAQRERLQLQMVRHTPEVDALVKKRATAEADKKLAEASKDNARTELDALMGKALVGFQEAINAWLKDFGAPFSLKELKQTYIGGGAPRSEYVIDVRGASVVVGPAATGELSFHTALSEGDKRTLAFAFFLAKLFGDPARGDAIVVLDDVFTSLDQHRRTKTVDAVVAMAQQCRQVLALGHDAYFLREIGRQVVSRAGVEVSTLELRRGPGSYTVIEAFDLDHLCSTPYYKRYRVVEDFVTGVRGVNPLEVALALRLLVESHLHRCFIGRFKDGQSVGQMLGDIRVATPENPISCLQDVLPDLIKFNDYAAMFHHDTSGGHARTDVVDGELEHYSSAALRFVQTGRLFS